MPDSDDVDRTLTGNWLDPVAGAQRVGCVPQSLG